ncbi:mRNA binding protein puf3 [Xylographa parallela]|nr:mRNA binding protein puf3 [Xylographa parallela]
MTSTTRNRFGDYGSASGLGNGEQPRTLKGSSIAQGFSNSPAWNSGIWGMAIGSGLKTDTDLVVPGTSDMKTGSGSLLSSSESESWSRHPNSQWSSISNITPGLGSGRNGQASTSPVHHRSSNAHARSSSPYFSTTQPTAIGQGIGVKAPSSTQSFLDPTSGSFKSSAVFHTYGQGQASRQVAEEVSRRPLDSIVFGANEIGVSNYPGAGRTASNASMGYSGYNSSAASRSGSLPPSRHGTDQPAQFGVEHSTNLQHLQFGTSDGLSHRPNQLSRNSTYSVNSSNKFIDHASTMQYDDLHTNFGKMDLSKENQDPLYTYYDYPQQGGFHGASTGYGSNSQTIRSTQTSFEPNSRSGSSLNAPHSQYRQQLSDRSSYSPSTSDLRRNHDSPLYSHTGTPPLADHHRAPSNSSLQRGNAGGGQAALLERKLRGLQQEQQSYMSTQRNPLQYQTPFHPYDYNQQNLLRVNPLAPYYSLPPQQGYQSNAQNYGLNRNIPQTPTVDSNAGESLRSTLLEEFRSNNKGTKRYELKDIYEHVVEFSGDQHGSRFIQQKLESANSDEKEQIFREILPNALQLMTDVFGNYVIQKFFEHGNQSQKKVLANQMKGHILDLSLQMYGCRVVQKAFEHILTDQQASLVKELEHQVLKCVKDQNGNHVVQKAIERIPAEHIHFIISAFTGQVHGLATHPYGCRVVQRMLEHCRDPSRKQLLEELHACAPSLIVDQYGNYVTQHVIEHGDSQDRLKIINLITAQLIIFSKHKFASNVVEKSIQCSDDEQRHKIVSMLTTLDDRGESPLVHLIKDQYGNYVIQKILLQLRGSEYDNFVDQVRPQLQLVKRFSYGKQVGAIEKLVYGHPGSNLHIQNGPHPPSHLDASAAPTPPLVSEDAQSPQSSSVPSTNTSTVDGPIGDRKEAVTAPVEVAASNPV